MDISSLINHFATYLLTQKRVANNTYSAYCKDLAQFKEFLESQKIDLEHITPKTISLFLAHMKKQNIGARTLSRKTSSLKAFFGYANQNYNMPNHSANIQFPKLEKRLPRYLVEDEVITLFKKAKEDTTSSGIRNSVMLQILYVTGLRISELINLKISSIDFESGFILVEGKGGKERMVPLTMQTLETLKIYLRDTHKKITNNEHTKFLFPAMYGKKVNNMTRQAFWMILKKIAKGTGIENDISPHKLRHTLATHLLQKGAGLRSLQILLGHENLTTVQIYTHLEVDHLRKIYDKKHPRA